MKLVAGGFAHIESYAMVVAAMLSIAIAGSPSDNGVNAVDRPRDSPIINGHTHAFVDVHQPLYAAVGRFTGTMACTAAIVAHPRIITTAGHCIAQKTQSSRPRHFSFQPGYQTGADLGLFEATVWTIGASQKVERQSAHDAANDWAILVLEHAPIDVRPFLLSHDSSDVLSSFERRMILPSYSRDAAGEQILTVDSACAVRERVWGVLVHDCKASPGSSGAPLLVRDQQWYAVVGIHSGSIWAADEGGRVAKLIGNSAIGSWAFDDALQELERRLESGEDVYRDAARIY